MGKILLDYVFPIDVIAPTPAASTAFLKQVCLVCKAKDAVPEGLTRCTSMNAVAALTNNTDAQQLFNAGMTSVYILISPDLDIGAALEDNSGKFFTVIVSSDFGDSDFVSTYASLVKSSLTFTSKLVGDDGNGISIEFLDTGTAGAEVVTVTGQKISVSMDSATSTATQLKTAIDNKPQAFALIGTAIASGQGGTAQTAFAEAHLAGGLTELGLGAVECVLALQTQDETVAAAQALIANRCVFLTASANKAKNVCFAFGKLLSNPTDWLNQQYIAMPFDDGIDNLGDANNYFDERISFVIADDEFGNKLALFVAGGKAIIAPYILKNLRIDMQSRAMAWISLNEPQYTLKEASLLEIRLQEDVINLYIARGWLNGGTVSVTLTEGGNFTATADLEIPEPKALWRVFATMHETEN